MVPVTGRAEEANVPVQVAGAPVSPLRTVRVTLLVVEFAYPAPVIEKTPEAEERVTREVSARMVVGNCILMFLNVSFGLEIWSGMRDDGFCWRRGA